jgi:hypothetical protein
MHDGIPLTKLPGGPVGPAWRAPRGARRARACAFAARRRSCLTPTQARTRRPHTPESPVPEKYTRAGIRGAPAARVVHGPCLLGRAPARQPPGGHAAAAAGPPGPAAGVQALGARPLAPCTYSLLRSPIAPPQRAQRPGARGHKTTPAPPHARAPAGPGRGGPPALTRGGRAIQSTPACVAAAAALAPAPAGNSESPQLRTASFS